MRMNTAAAAHEVDVNNGQELEGDVKLPNRASVSLVAGDGAMRQRLTILARRTGAGGGHVDVTTTNLSTKKNTRGMTEKFSSFDLAVSAMKKLEAAAISKGWMKSTRSGGFKAKPDAFSTMPVAPKTKK
jgi:hypothetical protein